MQYDIAKLRIFLLKNRKALNINGINTELKLPTNTISNFMHGIKKITEIHHKKVFDYFAELGYKEEIKLPNLELEELKKSLLDLTTKAKEKIAVIEKETNKL